MSLTSALDSARSSLMASGIQSSVISRNIAGATTTGYSRKLTVLDNLPGTGVYVAAIQRAASSGLYSNVLTATSASATQSAIYDGLQKIASATVDDPELNQSPTAQLNALKQALQQYANAPDNTTLGQAAVTSAKDMATALNQATQTVQSVREGADADMKTSVANINQLLSQFQTVNTAIVKGTIAGDDVTDYLDQRDSIVSSLSQEVGVTMAIRTNGDAALYTDSGVVLFDKTARTVSFTPTNAYSASTTGNAVFIDGVPVTGANSVMPIKSGKLAGLAQLRDNDTVTYQGQLDEIARGLINTFKESDQSGAALPDVPGLFTYPGSPAMPASATVSVGLAGTISVAASVDPAQGGNPNLLRDGAISGNAAYQYNTAGNAGYSTRLQQLIGNMDATQPFDATTQGKPSGSLIDFAASSTSWIENERKTANDNSTYQSTLLDRSTSALSNVNGVNMDDEMSLMLQVERTYSASSKIISTVDQMLQSLLAAVGESVMMSANYISSLMLSASLRYSITNNQSALSKASTEATTGRFADVGLQLGATTGGDVTLRADMSFADQLVDTNGLVSGRLDVTQDRITQLGSTASDFLKSLIAARSTTDGGRIILPPASANLQDLIGSLNVSYNGSYLFSGINTQNTPITAYTTGSASKNQVDSDFLSTFGFSQSSASVSSITPAQMQTFLDTTFDAEFASPAWNTNWSSATDQTMQSRISTTEIADTSVSANQTGFRKLAEAYTMMSDLGNINLDQTTFQTVVDTAIGLVGSAITDLATLGGNVGVVQQRITSATDKLNAQKDILNNQIVDIEKVDPAEASVRVNTLQTQIQTALALTSQLQKISLINYL